MSTTNYTEPGSRLSCTRFVIFGLSPIDLLAFLARPAYPNKKHNKVLWQSQHRAFTLQAPLQYSFSELDTYHTQKIVGSVLTARAS